MTIDEHTDLELARYNLQTDQTALDAIGAAIAQEQNRRDLAPTMAAFEAMKNAKENLRVNHASLVIDCRKAKDKLAKLATATARHADSVTHADNDLARANFALRAHARPDPNSYPLPEELAAWMSNMLTLQKRCSRRHEGTTRRTENTKPPMVNSKLPIRSFELSQSASWRSVGN